MSTNTLLIEGSFEELAEEFAVYVDNVKKGGSLGAEIAPLLEKGQKDEVLKKLIVGSIVLNTAPEREFITAYNLLVHLVLQSPNVDRLLPRVCDNLSQPVTSSPTNSAALQLSVLGTVFNVLSSDNDLRYHVFLKILQVVKGSGSFDLLKPQLAQLPGWLEDWEMDGEESRTLYLAVSDVASDAGEDDTAYLYLLKALQTFSPSESGSDDALKLALKALNTALVEPSHLDFSDLTSLDSIQSLRKSSPDALDLLDVFSTGELEDYTDFVDEHKDFLSKAGLDGDILTRKMRLLTFASLAATAPQRSLPYATIAEKLQVPDEDVEMWAIDTIRAGLVEGKLSQLEKTFLVHRATHRIFGQKQWREVAGRLDGWRSSLEGVLDVLRRERENMRIQLEREATEGENKARRNQQRAVDVGGD